MPAVWEQHYNSVLAGKAVSAEDHRLAVNTANVMGWKTFRKFHDCYLHTDVLALADVMESYRDSFWAQSGLNPIHYAARGRLGRHAAARKTPIHLITDEQAYKDVRASVMGGLSCIFQLKPTFFVTRAPWGIKPSVTKTTKQSSRVRRVRPKRLNAGEMIKTEKKEPETQRNKPQEAKRHRERKTIPQPIKPERDEPMRHLKVIAEHSSKRHWLHRIAAPMTYEHVKREHARSKPQRPHLRIVNPHTWPHGRSKVRIVPKVRQSNTREKKAKGANKGQQKTSMH